MTTNKIVANALKATGQFGKQAEELVRLYNRLTGDSVKDKVLLTRINTILRGLSSLRVQAWVMSDGTIAIAADKPTGGQPFRSLLNSANALKAKNGAYDTLIIRKDSKYNNLWCIYQDGSTNRAVPRVFESPDAAKKYIKEKMPAWGDAKIKVKNSIATNADNRFDTASFGNNDVKCEISLNAKRVARNANDWIDDPKKKRAMDEIDKKADALYRQLKDIARKFDALKNEQVKVGFYFADYSDAARQIREIHGME